MVVLVLAMVLSYGLEAAALLYCWQYKKYLVATSAALGIFAASGFGFTDLSDAISLQELTTASAGIAVVAAYRFFMQLIIADGRGHDEYMKRRAARSMPVFAGLQTVFIVVWWIGTMREGWDGSNGDAGMLLGLAGGVLGFLLGLLFMYGTFRSWQATKYVPADLPARQKDLPSVTLAIPARNETAALDRILRAAVASDYPKLEILVLDDCSQDATADIIKQFAHDGVRFVQGVPVPNERWVHRNFACQQLLDHTSGKLVLFAGVDIEFAPDSIGRMVAAFLSQDRHMIAVIPSRLPGSGPSAVQTIRYWWELAMPRVLRNRPPVLSSCWLAATKELQALGGFNSVNRMVVPEAFFAREFNKRRKYALLRGISGLGIRSRKSLADQKSTAIRVRYPQLRRRPELVLALTLIAAMVWVMPVMYFFSPHKNRLDAVTGITLAGWLLIAFSYIAVSRFYERRGLLVALVTSPFMPLLDLILLHVSMYRYEFGSIEWKGRNVCLPVMHVYKSLPPIEGGQDTLVAKPAKKS